MSAKLDGEFREFMHARWPAMVRLAYGLTGDQGHAEDVAQAAFARAYAAWATVTRSGDPDAYVRQIVINENRNRFRKRRVSERLTDSPPESALIDMPWTDAIREYDERSALMAALQRLGPRQRAVIVLRYWMDLTEHETAAAFAIPMRATITEVAAYSRHGEIAFAVPFNRPGGMAWIISWLQPGQVTASGVSGLIGSGTASGQAWSATVYLGPWGTCIGLDGGTAPGGGCFPSVPAAAGVITLDQGCTPVIAGGLAPAAAARVVVTQPDGTKIQVRLVTVGGRKVFAFAVRAGAKPIRWVAYDSAGKVVASSGR